MCELGGDRNKNKHKAGGQYEQDRDEDVERDPG